MDFIASLVKTMKRTEIIEILKKKYPNFNKSTMSMISNPDKYGVCLTKEANDYLMGACPELGKKPKAKKKPNRKNNRRLSVYVNDDVADLVQNAVYRHGYTTIQDYLALLIRRDI